MKAPDRIFVRFLLLLDYFGRVTLIDFPLAFIDLNVH